MKVSTQRLPESQVLLEIEVDPDQMEHSLHRAYRKLAQRIEVPGFRKGKTPRPMLERHVGRDRLVREALDILIPEAYNQALDAEEIDAIGQPVIELLKEEPLAFKATVPVRPTVELGPYQRLRVERPPVAVDPKDAESALEELRHRYALHEPVDRPVQVGDIVRASVRGVIEGREVYNDEDAEFHIRDGATILLPGFAEGLVGAQKGIITEVPVTAPPGSQPLSGKSGAFTVLVKEVKQERLPELDDQFAREVGEGFPSLEALRDRLTANLRERLEAEAERDYRDKAIDALVEQAEKIEFPPIMVEREIDHILRDQARAASAQGGSASGGGQDVDRYIQMMRRSLEELREEFRPAAVERVRRSLAITGLAEAEQIRVEPAEIDAEIEKIVGSSGPQADQTRRLFSSPEGRDAIERSLLTRKTMDRLVETVGQQPAQKVTAKRKKRSTKAGMEEKS